MIPKQKLIGFGQGRRGVMPAMAIVFLLLAACDFEVSNPGPVEDRFLQQDPAHEAMVWGMGRLLNLAIASGSGGGMGFDGACLAREWHPTGQTGSTACNLQVLFHELTPDAVNTPVNRSFRARWVAESQTARIKEARGEEGFRQFPLAPLANLYVAWSNRILGENMCETVIDGGPRQDFMIHFGRAETAASEALEIARLQGNREMEFAALGTRAAVRAWLGDWDNAVADAEQVPPDFRYQTFFNEQERDQQNDFFFAVSQPPVQFRHFTAWHTWYGENFDRFGDPRTPYRLTDFEFGMGGVADLGDGRGELGAVLYWQPWKYQSVSDPVNLTSGREAQLIVAEGRLRAGEWQAAVDIVNSIRAEVGVDLREAASAEDAWRWVKKEKLIELWLEGRALGERRRWLGDGPDGPTPVQLHEVHPLLDMFDRWGTDYCFPLSRTELETNPNLIGDS